WENKNLRSQMSGPVVIDGYIYGIDDNQLVCLDWKTGEKKWQEKSVGKGSLMAADGKLIIIGEKGKLFIAKATPEKFDLIASMQAIEDYCWTMPTLANGKIYVRNAKGKVKI
ncbi:MAG: PQQ-binding-like beta-propeller repeat protein, partial [Bacteroidales bacterium]|nr:PQQ-binding-like beta-propeller repeat protein [Bacteroidales bacterium]